MNKDQSRRPEPIFSKDPLERFERHAKKENYQKGKEYFNKYMTQIKDSLTTLSAFLFGIIITIMLVYSSYFFEGSGFETTLKLTLLSSPLILIILIYLFLRVYFIAKAIKIMFPTILEDEFGNSSKSKGG
jgi:hypothetical protein